MGVLTFCGIFLYGYQWKTSQGINLIPNHHLSNFWPFTQSKKVSPIILRKDYLNRPAVLLENFDSPVAKFYWTLWSRFHQAKKTEGAGIEKNSKSLVVIHSDAQNWALQSSYLIEVAPQDRFKLSADAKAEGESSYAAVSVVLYDAEKKVVEWKHGAQRIPASGVWEKVEGVFEVPVGISFVRVRFTGHLPVHFYVDRLELTRVE